jgi:translation initiation factor 4E
MSSDHKLQTSWCFWYDKKTPYKQIDPVSYRSKLIKLGSFNTVETFWKMYVHMKRPSSLELNVNLYLMRDGSNHAPLWEVYPRGGCWILKIKKKVSGVSVLGKMWQDIVFAAIGECFEEPTVVGISLCIRKNEDLISVWNSDSRNSDIKFNIGEKMKEILDLESDTVIEYKYHAESMQDLSTFRNAKAYVFQKDDVSSSKPDNTPSKTETP